MNNIYDLSDIQIIGRTLRGYIGGFTIYSLCVFGLIMADLLLIHMTFVAVMIFAIIILLYILSAILFWKIKYAILKQHMMFLENMDMGMKSEAVATFIGMADIYDEDDSFDHYNFRGGSGDMVLLIHKGYSVSFVKGEKYYIEQVGSYIYRWGKYENR